MRILLIAITLIIAMGATPSVSPPQTYVSLREAAYLGERVVITSVAPVALESVVVAAQPAQRRTFFVSMAKRVKEIKAMKPAQYAALKAKQNKQRKAWKPNIGTTKVGKLK